MTTASLTDLPLLWSLRAIARLERKGDVCTPRLTEPDLLRWNRVRRRLGHADLIALLHEDLAGPFPYPFDLSRWPQDPLKGLSERVATELVALAIEPDDSSPHAFLRQACRAVGLPPGGDIANLPKVQSHQQALELPGTGGRVALQQALDHQVQVDRAFAFVADSTADRVAIGLALVEVRANAPRVWTTAEAELSCREERFDHVFGVRGAPGVEVLASRLGLEPRWT